MWSTVTQVCDSSGRSLQDPSPCRDLERRAGPEADEDSRTAGVDETEAKAQRTGAERHSRADVPRSSTALSSPLWHPPRSSGPCRAFPVPVCCPRTPHTDCPGGSRSSSVVRRLPALRQSQKSERPWPPAVSCCSRAPGTQQEGHSPAPHGAALSGFGSQEEPHQPDQTPEKQRFPEDMENMGKGFCRFRTS